jgi:perosamine synthetase
MTSLALLDGRPLRSKPFPPHPIIGEEEKEAVLDVLSSGRLSTFIASPGEYFLGGKKIREFESHFAHYHGVKFAVAFNSATAALHAAVVAVGVEPGEEVIVPPYTFTSTATCALMHNAIPVFADIEDETFGLDPKCVEQAISPLTKAIIVVHLFGHPARMDELVDLAKRRSLRLIEDCAQAPGASYKGQPVGTLGDCGIFSFTENKNITTGEGGMLITDNPEVAKIAQLVRNHGEMITKGQAFRTYNSVTLGWNYRMTEIDAAIGIVQFARLDRLNRQRAELASHLSSRLSRISGISVPPLKPGTTHAFYVYPLKFDEQRIGIPRKIFVAALNAEGIPFSAGYVRPLYFASLYHEGRPFAFKHYKGGATYEPGLCPTTERLYEQELILTGVVRPPATLEDMDDIGAAFEKILEHKGALRELADG